MPKARLLLVALVVAAYATIAWSVFVGFPPLWFLVSLAAIYAIVVNLGVGLLSMQLFVDVLRRGPRGSKGVALTFDDGPHPEHTREVLDILDAFGAKATFFVIGSKAAANPDVVREIARRGHDLGIHSFTHDHFLNLRLETRIEKEIVDSADLIEGLVGERPRWFRPPVGFTSPRVSVAVRKVAVDVVGWSERAYDGLDVTTAVKVVERLAPRLADGDIVLLHDATEKGDRKPASVGALIGILEAMRQRGLEGVKLSTWRAAFEAEGRLRQPFARSKPLPALHESAKEGGAR